MRKIILFLAVLAVLYAFDGAARADPMVGNAQDGLAYARAVCSDCHIVEKSQTKVGLIHSLSFEQIAADAGTTEMGLRAFLRTPHVLMPDYILTPEQTDDLVAYILGLKEPAGKGRP